MSGQQFKSTMVGLAITLSILIVGLAELIIMPVKAMLEGMCALVDVEAYRA